MTLYRGARAHFDDKICIIGRVITEHKKSN